MVTKKIKENIFTLLSIVSIVAIVAIVALVLTFIQRTSSASEPLVYDVFDEKGNLVAQAVGDTVYPLIEDSITGAVIYKSVSKTSYQQMFPTHIFVLESNGPIEEAMGGGAGWN